MPRLGRVVVPNHPHHIVQRGHNKEVVFAQEAVFRFRLSTLEDSKALCGVKVYGLCLMTNHVHLILQPGEATNGLRQLMKRLSVRQARFVNRQESRTGTLWEGRYRSSPIATDAYRLACCRYVELNPVRARMTENPAAYPWFSYGWHAGVGTYIPKATSRLFGDYSRQIEADRPPNCPGILWCPCFGENTQLNAIGSHC